MLLSIIIVNYKTPELLLNCIQSIYDETSRISFEVIVVDNDSRDNSRQVVANRFPQVQWVQVNYNSGFARANNEGIRHSHGDAVLLLNSDTIVRERAIEGAFIRLMDSPFVACGVQLQNADGSPQISGNFFMKGGLNNLLPLPYIGNFLKSIATGLRVRKPHLPDATTEEEVDWINGAFLMVKKSAIDAAGLMDEDFFLYAEESEWCYRLGKTGKLAIFGRFRVTHLQGETSNATFGSQSSGYYNLYDRKGLQIMLSNFVRIRKQFGSFWFLLQLCIYTLDIPVYFFGLLIEGIFSRRKKGNEWTRLKQFASNTLRVWQLAPIIIRNRPYFYKVL